MFNSQKPNPNNSSIVQALLDIKAAGGPAPLVNGIMEVMEGDETVLKDAEALFHSHLYPQHSLTFVKVNSGVEIAKFLTTKAMAVLTAMCQNMWSGNLIQLSQRDILKITSISSLRSVKPALQELIDNGCIAVAIPGNTRRAPVYMVNPEIATVGKDDFTGHLQFWEYTGTDYSDFKNPVESKPHETWNKLTDKRTYAKSRTSQETDRRTLYFNKITEPRVKTNKQKKDIASRRI